MGRCALAGADGNTSWPRSRPSRAACGAAACTAASATRWAWSSLCYLQADDPALFDEMIETVAELCYRAHGGGAGNVRRSTSTSATSGRTSASRSGPLVNPRVFQAEGRPALPAHHRSAARPRHQHRLAGLRRQDRRADPDLVRERRQHHVPDRGRHLERQHRAVAREVRPGTARRRRHGQEGLRLRLCGDRRRGRAPASRWSTWAATSPAPITASRRTPSGRTCSTTASGCARCSAEVICRVCE